METRLKVFERPKIKRLLAALDRGPRASIKGDPRTTAGTLTHLDNTHLFVNGIDFRDVNQGQLGDCYFASALASVALTHPEIIQRGVKENRDGSLSLQMFHLTRKGTFQSDTVTMNDKLPVANGKLVFAHGSDPTQVWPAFFQKAYAMQVAATKRRASSYQTIGEGGFPGDVFAALTGHPSRRYAISPQLGEQLFTVLQHAGEANAPVAAWTPPTLPAKSKAEANHAYSVLGVSERDGKKLVKLRNPLGHSPGNDGIFELDLPTFSKTFAGVDIGS